MKKLVSLLLCIVLTMSTVEVYATKYAYCIGTKYTDIDTRPEVKYVTELINEVDNFVATAKTAPTYTWLKGNNPNGIPILGSKVVFLSGHADSNSMSFNYKGKGGNYATGLRTGSTGTTSKGYKYVGVNDVDMSHTKLFVLAGCETAKGEGNITCAVMQNGATTSLGWSKSVSATSQREWLEIFFERYTKGYSVIQCKNYANSYKYDDLNVKNAIIYGNSYGKLFTPSGSEGIPSTLDPIIYEERANVVCTMYQVSVDMSDELVFQALRDGGIEVNESDFTIIRSEGVIDLVYMVNGVATDYGYSMVIANPMMVAIYDNMPKEEEIPQETTKVTEEEIEVFEQVAINSIQGQSGNVSQSGELIYDIDDRIYKYRVFTDYIANDRGEKSREEMTFTVGRKVTLFKAKPGKNQSKKNNKSTKKNKGRR